VPFMFVDDAGIALRVSNAVAIGLLFGCGWGASPAAVPGVSGWACPCWGLRRRR